MGEPQLRLLHVEDSKEEALYIVELLLENGYQFDYVRVDTPDDLTRQLERQPWDLVLCDYSMPGWDGIQAIRMIRERDRIVPILVISGVLSEEGAVESLKAGAQDFIHKLNLARFIPAVERELKEVEVRRNAHETENALRQLELRNQHILNLLPNGLLITDTQHRVIEWNREAERITGLSSAEVLGRVCNELWGNTCGEFCKLHDTGSGAIHQGTCEFQRGDQTLILQKSVDALRNDAGERIGTIEVFSDITREYGLQDQLTASEMRYRDLIENLREGIGEMTLDGVVTYLNSTGKALFEFDPTKELERFRFRDYVDHEGIDTIRKMWSELKSNGKSDFQIEIHLPSGIRRILQVTTNPLLDGQEEIIGVYGIFHDLTEVQHQKMVIEKQAARLKTQMRELNCLYSISRIVVEERIEPEDIFDQAVRLLPHGFSQPESLKAQIEYQGVVYGDKKMPTKSEITEEPITLAGKKEGALRVAYHKRVSELRISAEEREMLRSVSDLISHTINRARIKTEIEDHIEFLQTMLNTIPFPVFYKDLNGEYLGCNEAFADQVYGLPRADIIGKTMDAFERDIPPEEAKRFADIEERIKQTGEPEYYESSLNPRWGKRRDYLFTKALFHNSKGEKLGLVGVMVDITRRKQAESILRQQLELEKTLSTLTSEYVSTNDSESTIENTLLSLGSITKSRHVIHVRILAKDHVQYEEFHLTETQPGISKLSLEVKPKRLNSLVNKIERREILILRGEEYDKLQLLDPPVSSHADDNRILLFPYRIGDEIAGWVEFHHPESVPQEAIGDYHLLIVSEISIIGSMIERDHRESELRILRTAMEGSVDAIVIMEITGTIIYVNKAFENLTGFSKEESVGQTFYLVVGDDQPKDFYEQAVANIASGNDWTETITTMRKDGSSYKSQVSVSPIYGESGEVTHMVSIGRDITDTLEMEAQLRQAQKLEAIGQLAAGIAHEINTPVQYIGDNTQFLLDNLTGVFEMLGLYEKGLAEVSSGTPGDGLLEELKTKAEELDLDYLREEMPDAIKQSLEGVDRVANIVKAMKEFSHPGLEDKQPIDLESALNSTATVARNVWKYVADLTIEVQPELPQIWGYAAELNQVFLNMIINSTHAIEERFGSGGEKQGRIEIRAESHTKDMVIVRVKDNGNGIPAKIVERVYDPFFTTKSIGKGTGQGLAIAYHVVVEKHKGKIDFTSIPGQGTEFVLQLPTVNNPHE